MYFFNIARGVLQTLFKKNYSVIVLSCLVGLFHGLLIDFKTFVDSYFGSFQETGIFRQSMSWSTSETQDTCLTLRSSINTANHHGLVDFA